VYCRQYAMGKICELNEKIYTHTAKQFGWRIITHDSREPLVALKSGFPR